MRCLQMIIFVLVFLNLVENVSPDDGESSFFKFRKTTLDRFNDARRLIAGGDLKKIAGLLATVAIGIDNIINLDALGPAANMYQLKWSRDLEQIGFEYMEEKLTREKDPFSTIKYKEHIGFYWMGNIFKLLEKALEFMPFPKLQIAFKEHLDMIETLIIVVWFAKPFPKSLPLEEGQNLGPAHALFGERYEIGCFTELFYSVCFMKKLPYREHMFKVGVPCTSCPTHCEFWEEADETIEEGELCVPPKEPQMNYVAANMTMTGAAKMNSITISIILPLIMILILQCRR